MELEVLPHSITNDNVSFEGDEEQEAIAEIHEHGRNLWLYHQSKMLTLDSKDLDA